MKKLVLVLGIMSGVVASLASAQFTSSFVEVNETEKQSLMSLIDSVYDPYIQRQVPSKALQTKLTTIQNTLVQYLNTTAVSDTTFYALEYLIHRIKSTSIVIPTPVVIPAPTITPANTTNQSVPATTIVPAAPVATPPTVQTEPTLDVSSYYQGDKNILAGSTSQAVFKYELIAQLEGVRIEQLAFAANIPNFEKAVEKVHIYDETGKWLDSQRPSTNKVSFKNLDRDIPVGQTDMYVVIESKKIGYNSSAPQTATFSLNLDIQEAYGLISGNEYPLSTHTASESVTIVPTLLTHVLLTDSWENRSIDAKLHSGETDLGIVVIGNKTGSNTSSQSGRNLTTQIERISVVVQDNTTLGNVVYNMSLTPVQGGPSILGSFQNGAEVVFDLTSLGNDALVNNNEEIAFVISSDIPTLDPVNQESVTLKLISTDTGGVVYKTSDPTSLSITTLNLRQEPTNKLTLID